MVTNVLKTASVESVESECTLSANDDDILYFYGFAFANFVACLAGPCLRA